MKEIPLTQGLVALVDDEDFERLSFHKWHARRNKRIFYAARYSSGVDSLTVWMHQEIMGGKPEFGFHIDHIDGDGLNNQRGNLREATASQNHMNRHRNSGSSIYKGVCWDSGKWRADIRVNGKLKYLGRFVSEEAAGRAYDVAALDCFGEFARPNFSVGN